MPPLPPHRGVVFTHWNIYWHNRLVTVQMSKNQSYAEYKLIIDGSKGTSKTITSSISSYVLRRYWLENFMKCHREVGMTGWFEKHSSQWKCNSPVVKPRSDPSLSLGPLQGLWSLITSFPLSLFIPLDMAVGFIATRRRLHDTMQLWHANRASYTKTVWSLWK